MVFVTTDDTRYAKKAAGITKLPAIVLFRNGQPMVYKGKFSPSTTESRKMIGNATNS